MEIGIGIGIALLLAIIGFLIYGSLAVKHAARFRYLSTRTVYLSLAFVGLSSLTIAAIIVVYLILVLN